MTSSSDYLRDETAATTFWETVGLNRWSQYLLSIEEDLVSRTLDQLESQLDRPGVAIEIGCDGGKWSQMLDARGWKLTCVDINEESLELCRQRLPHATTILADAEDTTYNVEGGQFDLVLAIQVPPAKEAWFAHEAARLLRPNGYFVFDMVNGASYRSLLSYLRSMVRRDDTYYSHHFADVRAECERVGFTMLESVGHAWAPFSRESNSSLIPVATTIERVLGLRRLSRYSPWVISALQLDDDPTTTSNNVAQNLRGSDQEEVVSCESS